MKAKVIAALEGLTVTSIGLAALALFLLACMQAGALVR